MDLALDVQVTTGYIEIMADPKPTLYILKNHNGTELGRFTVWSELTAELHKYELWTGNTTQIEVVLPD